VVFVGDDEAALVTDRAGTPDQLTALAALGPREVIVKEGARGCVALIDGERHTVAALPVTVVDPVGAGDAFAAGYLAERLAAAAPAARLSTAVSAGAFAVTVPGDCEGLPDRAELAALTGADLRR
jgi:2-dehydro-3-deoxygluconokinase